MDEVAVAIAHISRGDTVLRRIAALRSSGSGSGLTALFSFDDLPPPHDGATWYLHDPSPDSGTTILVDITFPS